MSISNQFKDGENTTAIGGTSEIVPESFETDTFDIRQEIVNFKTFASQEDIANMKGSINVINKYFKNSTANQNSLFDEETIAFLLKVVKMVGDGQFIPDLLCLRKECFLLVTNLASNDKNCALLLVQNNIFAEFKELLAYKRDAFTSDMTADLFMIIINYDNDFCQNALENGVLDALIEALHIFIGLNSMKYLKNVGNLTKLLVRFAEFTDIVDEEVIKAIIAEVGSIIAMVAERVKQSPYNIDPRLPDDPLTNFPASTFEIAIINTIAKFVSDNANSLGIVTEIFNSRTIFTLNDILNVSRARESFAQILCTDADLVVSLSENEEMITALLDYINPVFVMQLFLTKPTASYGSAALKYLNNALNAREEIAGDLPLGDFINVISNKFEKVNFSTKMDIIRLSFNIILHGSDEFLEAIIARDILQYFISSLMEADYDVKLSSVLTFQSVFQRYTAQKKSLEEIISYLENEYKDQLGEWIDDPNPQLNSAASELYEAMDE